jgi:membrane-associated phospholipid phosphatase
MRIAGRTLLWWGVLLAGVVVTTLVDQSVWGAWHPADEAAKVAFEKRDVVQMLRSMGYVPTWIAIGAAAWLLRLGERGRMSGHTGSGAWRGWLITISAALAGGLAELLKLIVARERPGIDGAYVWRGLFSGFTNPGNLGMASSHAGVAFGGAFMVMLLHPRAAWVVLPLAMGCATVRVGTGAHYLSDVWVGAVLGYVAAVGLARLTRIANHHGTSGRESVVRRQY